MITVPYQWLLKEPAPRMLLEALKIFGTKETVGPNHNPVIMGWAKELGVDKIYLSDEMPWCGLAHCLIAQRAHKVMPFVGYEIIRAKSWLKWGNAVLKGDAMLGDTLVFERPNGHHVGLYVGEDKDCYHVLGGNQSNSYSITRINKSRLAGVRRQYVTGMPPTCRKIILKPLGFMSKDEA